MASSRDAARLCISHMRREHQRGPQQHPKKLHQDNSYDPIGFGVFDHKERTVGNAKKNQRDVNNESLGAVVK